jgi:hypothetical protein
MPSAIWKQKYYHILWENATAFYNAGDVVVNFEILGCQTCVAATIFYVCRIPAQLQFNLSCLSITSRDTLAPTYGFNICPVKSGWYILQGHLVTLCEVYSEQITDDTIRSMSTLRVPMYTHTWVSYLWPGCLCIWKADSKKVTKL